VRGGSSIIRTLFNEFFNVVCPVALVSLVVHPARFEADVGALVEFEHVDLVCLPEPFSIFCKCDIFIYVISCGYFAPRCQRTTLTTSRVMKLSAWKISVIVFVVFVLLAAVAGVACYLVLDPHAPALIQFRMLSFQHNKTWRITNKTYSYVYEYKRELLSNLTRLLDDVGIRFVISHGNLIELARGTPIYHDDDLDLRFDERDFDKWMAFCQKPDVEEVMPEYNLVFDGRLKDAAAQKYNGIQVGLVQFAYDGCDRCASMDIYADLVASRVQTNMWPAYDIDFDNVRDVRFMGVATHAPSEADADAVLRKQYGDYTRPHRLYRDNEFTVE
jgi:hypothetical protein